MRLLVAIPAYNEEAVIVPTVQAVAKALFSIPGLSWHILVADNASSDKTSHLVRAMNLPYVSVVTIEQKGKGKAIREAASFAESDAFCFIDADLSADPSHIAALLGEVERGAHMAIGSRLLDRSRVHRGAMRTLSSYAFNTIRKAVLGVHVLDSQCGLKIMDKKGTEVLKRCIEDTWFLDVELLARATRAGLTISEIPITWEEERYAGRQSKLSVVRDGLGAIVAFFRIRRNMRL